MLRLHKSYLLAVLLLALAALVIAGCGTTEAPATLPETGGADATPGMMGSTAEPGGVGDMMGDTAQPGNMMSGTAEPGDVDDMMSGTAEPGDVDDMMGGTSGAMDFDQAFIDMMVPHHQGAVEMARIAQQRAEHPEIRQMADAIVAGQEPEIAQMRRWRQEWFGSSDTPSMSAMPMLSGMPGMGQGAQMMDMAREVETLRNAPEPFDLAFIDAMIEHHQSAIDAATLGLEQSTRQEIKDLARAIVEAQQQEIDLLRAWRDEWYPDAAQRSTPLH